jgi:FG-GAP-like repeat
VNVLTGNGDGTLQGQVAFAAGSGPLALTSGDFNGDGKIDIAVANMSGNDVTVLLNTSSH